jgi:DNA-directed RNA polymerase subunit D
VPNAFVFSVETDGSMSVEDLVLAATETILDRAEELRTAVQL